VGNTPKHMGSRRQPRVKGILPVRIWGLDRQGKPFAEHVCTADISGTGASLAGVSAQLALGDTIGLQFRNRQARFRIVWITPASESAATRVGVECLQPDKNPWPVTPPGEEPDPYMKPEVRLHKYEKRESDARRATRFPITGQAFVSRISGGEGFWARICDISLAGCYLQTDEPLEVARRVALLIKTGAVELEATGVVRTHYARMAMGIEFTFMSKADRQTLAQLVSHLEECDTVSA